MPTKQPFLSPAMLARYRRGFKQREQARFEAGEKRREAAKQNVGQAIEVISDRYPTIQRVYLFGSILKPGRFRPASDIDIGIEGANTALCLDIWRDLERAIPNLSLDVRSLDPQDLFSERVWQKGELIYERANDSS